MTHIHLTFYERIHIWHLIGSHTVPRLKEAAILLRLMEKVRPTDEELGETHYVAVTDSQVNWKVSSRNYGERDVSLEGEEAQALIQVFEAAQGIRVSDAAWIVRLTEILTPEEQAA